MIKSFIILCVATLTLSAVAQSSLGNISISTRNPEDSIIHLDARLNPGVEWVWIDINKGSQNEKIFVETKNRQFPVKAYLKFGPGKYIIQTYLTTNPKQFSNNYQFGPKFELTNLDPRTDLDVRAPSDYIQSEHPEIVSLAHEITSGLETDLEKTRAIYDWVIGNIAYDVNGYFTGTYAVTKYDALKTLTTREAVCEGYANLTAALNRAAGIPTKVVKGEGRIMDQPWTGKINHAWNETLVDGEWISQDATWDAGHVDFVKQTFHPKPGHKYFNPTRDEFAKNHREMP